MRFAFLLTSIMLLTVLQFGCAPAKISKTSMIKFQNNSDYVLERATIEWDARTFRFQAHKDQTDEHAPIKKEIKMRSNVDTTMKIKAYLQGRDEPIEHEAPIKLVMDEWKVVWVKLDKDLNIKVSEEFPMFLDGRGR